MELTDVYDSERKRTGKVVPRYQWGEGEFRLTVHTCIFDRDRMLIQKRSGTKRIHPGLWDLSSAGQVDAGEDSHEGATRELEEELGIRCRVSESDRLLTIRMPRTFDDIYVLEYDGSDMTLQESEVDDVRWATESEIVASISEGTFIAYRPEFIATIFDANRTGTRNIGDMFLDDCVLPRWKDGYA